MCTTFATFATFAQPQQQRRVTAAAGRNTFDNFLHTSIGERTNDEMCRSERAGEHSAFCFLCLSNAIGCVCHCVHMPKVKLCRSHMPEARVFLSKRAYTSSTHSMQCSTPIIPPLFERRQYLYSILLPPTHSMLCTCTTHCGGSVRCMPGI